MKKRILILLLILVVAGALYLNRSYAHIYKYIDLSMLGSSNIESSYALGDISKKEITYVALGDSLTAGVGVNSYKDSYPYLVAKNISEEGEKVNLKPIAVPGAKTEDVLLLVDSVIKLDPSVVTILIGVNDIHGNISKDEFQKNYELLLNRLTSETSANIYIINIPYIGTDQLIKQPYNYFFNKRTQNFNAVLKQLSEKFSSQYIDLYTSTLQNSNDPQYYASDYFHPSVLGYQVWAQIIYDNFNH